MEQRPLLSVVATMYRSDSHLEEFCRRVVRALSTITDDYEIVLVNDGCPQDSLAVARRAQGKYSNITIVDLARNYGQHKAIMSGLSHARGRYVFLIDSDLEEDPAWLPEFWRELRASPGIDVVYGVQKSRKGGTFERASGWAFYSIYNAFTDVEIPRNICTVRIMTRRYIDQLLLFRERELSLCTVLQLTGFTTREIKVEKLSRGDSTYGFVAKWNMMVDAIISASAKPLWYLFYLGACIAGTSSLYSAHILFRYFVRRISVDGWTSLILSVWGVGGFVVMSIGVLGIYISKIFMEVKQRPVVTIRGVYSEQSMAHRPGDLRCKSIEFHNCLPPSARTATPMNSNGSHRGDLAVDREPVSQRDQLMLAK